MWFITLKSSAFYISESEKIELCGILNDFLNEYQKAYENYKKMLGAEKFEITKSNHVKLLTVTKNLWIKMMKFSHEFDFDRGKSEWHIFNQNRVSIIVQGPDSVIYNAWLNTERTESNYNDFLDNEETVDIVWVIPGLTEINKPGVWNATKTYWWLKDQFIPKVLDYYTPLSKRLFSKL